MLEDPKARRAPLQSSASAETAVIDPPSLGQARRLATVSTAGASMRPGQDRSLSESGGGASPARPGKVLRILGTRGIPAAHGGFETFAERLSVYLAARGWRVSVYCQISGSGSPRTEYWNGVERVLVPVKGEGSVNSVFYDFKCILHAIRHGGLCLTLGYNTAVFCALLRLARLRNVINMDGIEWKRGKWGAVAKLWFRFNERAGSLLGDHLVADHPRIAAHLESRGARRDKITMIPYGALRVGDVGDAGVSALGLELDRYLLVIARPEPENSILEIVRAFKSSRSDLKLVVLGTFRPDTNPYHRQVMDAADHRVIFPGAIYEPAVVGALRLHCRAYVHGHQVGGTNPSLLESMAAGNFIIAHDNEFNRWVAGPSALYFLDEEQLCSHIEQVSAPSAALHEGRRAISERYASTFTWEHVLPEYENLLAGQWELSGQILA